MSGGLASLATCCVLVALFTAGRGLGAVSSARRLVGASCLVLVFLVGCGGEGAPPSDSADSATAERTTPAVSAAEQARADTRQQRRDLVALERSSAPNPWKEPGALPPHPHEALKHLIVRDVKRGRGPRLRGDESVNVNYVKTYWRSGRKFLVAWGPLRASYLSLPAQPPGMRRGMIGMRPGGRRTIAIPTAMGDIHEPYGRGGGEASSIDIVLRNIVDLD